MTSTLHSNQNIRAIQKVLTDYNSVVLQARSVSQPNTMLPTINHGHTL